MKVVKVSSPGEGENFVKDFLYKNCDEQTVLFLSGGKTPKSLYEHLLAENKLKYGAVGMIDERYGEVGHENGNANIMKGFKNFYPTLNGENLENTALQYDQTVRSLFKRFQKSIGVLGIGSDGHTASLPARSQNSKFKSQNDEELVAFVEDFPGESQKRVTMTFNALSKLDKILILVFGEDKKGALKKMFTKGLDWEIPARFFLHSEISQKTILITDQKV